MAQDRKTRLQEFAAWAAAHITGDEKGEAQIFLDRLFIAFGRKGSLDVGGKPEFRIRKRRVSGRFFNGEASKQTVGPTPTA